MCIVSDRNESIIKSVSIVYPNVPHCAYGICGRMYVQASKGVKTHYVIYFTHWQKHTETKIFMN